MREWYKDSKGIGTWGIGVTNASGQAVNRYKDDPLLRDDQDENLRRSG